MLKWKRSRFLRKWGIKYTVVLSKVGSSAMKFWFFRDNFHEAFYHCLTKMQINTEMKRIISATLLSVLLYFRFSRHRLFIPYVGIFCFMLLWLTATQNIWQVPYCPWNFILLVDTFVQIQTRFWIIALIDLITVLEAAISTTRQRLIRNDSVCKRIPITDHSLNNWIQKNLWIARLKY